MRELLLVPLLYGETLLQIMICVATKIWSGDLETRRVLIDLLQLKMKPRSTYKNKSKGGC